MYGLSRQANRHDEESDDDRPQLPARKPTMDSTLAVAGSPEWAPDTHGKRVKQKDTLKSHQNVDSKDYNASPAKKLDGAVVTAEKGKQAAESANKAKMIEEEELHVDSVESAKKAKMVEEEELDSVEGDNKSKRIEEEEPPQDGNMVRPHLQPRGGKF